MRRRCRGTEKIKLHQKQGVSRRGFLRDVAATTAFAIVPRHVLGGDGHVPPSEKTTLAGVGVGGQGIQNMVRFQRFPEVQVVAVCDVNRQGEGYLSWNWSRGTKPKMAGREVAREQIEQYYAQRKGSGNYKGCRTYADYRELLEQEDVDAVMIATPDHVHAVVTMAALGRGKHVYCEKPLTYSVYEARQVTEAARRAGVATQLGNQGQASEEARLVQEYIRDGALGPVRDVHVTVGPPFWDKPAWGTRPPETPAVPEGLDWDLWLGPAPQRPYHPAYHPWRWRDWRDFGTGPLGDMGCHKLSTVFKALKLKYPVSVEATCTEIGPEVYPRVFRVRYEFPAREGMPPVALTWHGGGLKPPRPEQLESDRRISGDIYIGDDAVLMGHRLIPETNMQEYGRPPKVLPRSVGHDREWIDACRGGPAAGSDFVQHAGLLTETPLLGNIAMRVGEKLQWDGPNMTFTNHEKANQYLHRDYRDPWTLSLDPGR
ncbi:MAG: Gfo/Idh/MocA family protein [Planctomycetota bacterium]